MENTLTNIQDIIEGIKNPGTIEKKIIFDSISNLSLTDLETIATNLPIVNMTITYELIKDDLVTFLKDCPKFSDLYILNDNETYEIIEEMYNNLEKKELIIFFIKNIYYNNNFCKSLPPEPVVNKSQNHLNNIELLLREGIIPSENIIELLLREGIIPSENTIQPPLENTVETSSENTLDTP